MIKKILLTTSALASFVAANAFADAMPPSSGDLNIKIGGNLDAQVIASDTKGKDNLTTNNGDVAFDHVADVFLEAKSSTAKGLEYGAHVGLQGLTSSAKQNNSKVVNRTYMWLEHMDLGRVEFGSAAGADVAMRTGAGSVAVATGGVEGDWFKVLNKDIFGLTDSTNVNLNEFVISPWSVGDNRMNFDFDTNQTNSSSMATRELARKITYFTPKYNGFQGGITYTPDDQNRGNTANLPFNGATNNGDIRGWDKNIVSAGISWDGKISNDIMSKFSVVGVTGSTSRNYGIPNNPEINNLKGVDVGAKFDYQDMSAAVSYGWLGKTDMQKNATGTHDTFYVTAGLGYKFDNLHTSLTYMYGNKNKNKSNVVSLGAEYAMAPGFMPYAEATFFDLKQNREGALNTHQNPAGNSAGSGTSNSGNTPAVGSSSNPNSTAITGGQRKTHGTAFIIGTKLKF